MVKLTSSLIEKKYVQLRSGKSLSQVNKKCDLWKLTHLHMSDMFISEIGNFAECKHLKVIYLQNNQIGKIENLHFLTNLTHLYLQHNKINKIENLECLRKLQILYLGYNCVSVVEGLHELHELIELHIENQNLAVGESLCFEPRTVATLSQSLQKLNISNNKIASLDDIRGFYKLEVLEAKENLIENIEDLVETISTLISLKELFLHGNPVAQQHRYRESVIANSNTLVNFDGKDVTEVCRRFMKNFQEKHLEQTTKKVKIPLSEDIAKSLNLPPAFKRSITRAMFKHTGPKLCITVTSATGEKQPQLYPAWKTAPAIRAARDDHITPRPFWRSSSKNKVSNDVPYKS